MDRTEYDYVFRSLRRLREEGRPAGLATEPPLANHRLVEMTDNELLHIALGVET
jgi:hypothetical protein